MIAKMRTTFSSRKIAGVVLAELMMASAVFAMTSVALLVGLITIQRTFRASLHHSKSQIEQARLIDYVGKDLRRALTVAVDNYADGERLQVTIPDYYQPRPSSAPARSTAGIADSHDEPRDPVISGRSVEYGNPAQPVHISYYRRGSTVYRNYNGAEVPLATDVEDFRLDFTDGGQQSVQIAVTFMPKFSTAFNRAEIRAGTTATATTLLRNKRR